MKTYTETELKVKKLSELKEIARALNVEPLDDARAKANWIREILGTLRVHDFDGRETTPAKSFTMPIKVEPPVQNEEIEEFLVPALTPAIEQINLLEYAHEDSTKEDFLNYENGDFWLSCSTPEAPIFIKWELQSAEEIYLEIISLIDKATVEAPLTKLSELQAGDVICAPHDTKHEQPLEVITVFEDCLKVKGDGKEFKLSSAAPDTEVALINRKSFNWSDWKIDPVKTRTVNASEDGKRKIEINEFAEKTDTKTCADCQLFKSFDDGSSRGLCCGTDTVARAHHKQTGDCLHLIEQHQEESEKTIEIVVAEWDASGLTSVFNTYEITLEAQNLMRQTLIYKSGLEWRIVNTEGLTTEVIYRRLVDAINARVQLVNKAPANHKQPDSEYTLEPAGKTDLTVAYNVRRRGSQIGMIFHSCSAWQCGDGKTYANSHDAIEALSDVTEPRLLLTNRQALIYQSPDGALTVRQNGNLGKLKLWCNNKDIYYYRDYFDAARGISPIALRCDSLRVGEKVFFDEELTVCSIDRIPLYGLMGIQLTLSNGVKIKTNWYEPIQIAV